MDFDKTLYFVPEIGLKKYGRADWLICDMDENNNNKKITDMAHLEFQSDVTTGTRSLVQCVADFFNGDDITKSNYRYGLNSKASIKSSSLQMIDKGFLFQKLGKKSFWVLQESLFDILLKIYDVKMLDITNDSSFDKNTLIFIVVSLILNRSKNKYVLDITKCYSVNPSDLQSAIAQKKVNKVKYINTISKIVRKKIDEGDYFKIMS